MDSLKKVLIKKEFLSDLLSLFESDPKTSISVLKCKNEEIYTHVTRVSLYHTFP